MALIAATLTTINDATLKIGADNYETSISKCILNPTTPKAKFKGIAGNTLASVGTPDWTADIDLAQDWATANSLTKYLLDHVGDAVVMEFYPKAGGTGYTATVLIEPGALGGTADAEALASVSLAVVGQPTEI